MKTFIKFKSILNNYTPDEWGNVFYSLKDISRALSNTCNGKKRVILGIIWLFLFGLLIGYGFLDEISDPVFKKYALKSLMVALGFIITLMIFTGKIDNLENNELEIAKEVSKKIHYFLANQAITFFIILSSIIAYFVSSEISKKLISIHGIPSMDYKSIGDIVAFALLVTSSIRIAILPFQIYEIHSFSLSIKLDIIRHKIFDRYGRNNKKAG